ncbi:MAG: hypothetical protein WA069_04125 [Candidatus Moraniibacteriota bacterium]
MTELPVLWYKILPQGFLLFVNTLLLAIATRSRSDLVCGIVALLFKLLTHRSLLTSFCVRDRLRV